jgi:hypothetical protein
VARPLVPLGPVLLAPAAALVASAMARRLVSADLRPTLLSGRLTDIRQSSTK